MRRTTALLLRDGGGGIPQALADVLVCPLSKKPLRWRIQSPGTEGRGPGLGGEDRFCESSGSLVSDTLGISFPIVDGIPHLLPKDGKLLEDHQEKSRQDSSPGNSSD